MAEGDRTIEAAGQSGDQPGTARDIPLYERLKADIKKRIETGEWPPHHRVPSENEIADTLNVSRMTANRALRELASEGVIVRVQGRGSFVATKKRSAPFMGVRNIADEITERGAIHTAEVILAQTEVCGHELAEAMNIEVGLSAFHSVILHHEDEVPIQLEDRFVNPAVAPDYLGQDFRATTPNAYLTRIAPISHTEQFVEAVLPQPWECKHLSIARSEPCLLIRRRTWSADRIVTSVRLLYPGSRYRLESSS
ncbi:transcriptional regulator, GntR family with UTRA sensor domain-containing protein [Rhizobium sp. PDO1-076]|uniref:histidine utilization repressor n=1 Tax=Rhizobium sp. PDO1-076 TaxID=1125979 RepID=UPI00024E35E7|nr:histidine utilization repressor [Rhizobium sp. PDO1-076]EHS51367.1 transcriptional regulator, GntR family with UTRA sensor domain-containing protein [Rhizobium sp. PDO1-076]